LLSLGAVSIGIFGDSNSACTPAPTGLRSSTDPSRPQTRGIFTSSDGAFRFTYSHSLVACPSESCEAYFPMCNQEGSDTLACFAYDKNKLKDFPEFEAATFSVAEISDATTRDDCLNIREGWRYENPGKLPTTTIHGATFTIMNFGEGGMSQGLEAKAYRSFREGTCYQLSVRIATVYLGATAKSVREQKLRDVRERLNQALYSFEFLK